MSILVVAEHDNTALKPVTLNVIAAAKKLGGDLDVLVAGAGCKSVADQSAGDRQVEESAAR
jgi:electron transfer flavoprotein alpha subunit